MSRKGTTVVYQVNKILNSRVETGGKSEFENIRQQSQCGIDTFANDFRLNYGHLIAYPYKNGTVNRCVEQWIKANKARFE